MADRAWVLALSAALAVAAACSTAPPEARLVAEPSPAEACRAAQSRAPAPQGEASAQLTPILRIVPDYPPRAIDRAVEAICRMTFDVAADGLVVASSIAAECTAPAFTEPAIQAVERWCYAPMTAARAGVVSQINFGVFDVKPASAETASPEVWPRVREGRIDRADGLIGSCMMTHDVLPDGSVDADSIVADCSSPLLVELATRETASHRYEPTIVDGEPVVRRGVRTRIEFGLEN